MRLQSPGVDRWLTLFSYTQGSEAFKRDLRLHAVGHALRDAFAGIDGHRRPVLVMVGTMTS